MYHIIQNVIEYVKAPERLQNHCFGMFMREQGEHRDSYGIFKRNPFHKKQPDQFLYVKNNSSNQVVNITV